MPGDLDRVEFKLVVSQDGHPGATWEMCENRTLTMPQVAYDMAVDVAWEVPDLSVYVDDVLPTWASSPSLTVEEGKGGPPPEIRVHPPADPRGGGPTWSALQADDGTHLAPTRRVLPRVDPLWRRGRSFERIPA
uniref:Uncharacterized protein n=1 Tax=Alexandrium catenella TaxID=2925 RepID=A0A7S1S2F2_ALECA